MKSRSDPQDDVMTDVFFKFLLVLLFLYNIVHLLVYTRIHILTSGK